MQHYRSKLAKTRLSISASRCVLFMHIIPVSATCSASPSSANDLLLSSSTRVLYTDTVRMTLLAKYNRIQYNAMQCNAMQCSAVQCSAVQCNAVQCSAMQCSAVQCSTVQYSTVQYNTIQYVVSLVPSLQRNRNG